MSKFVPLFIISIKTKFVLGYTSHFLEKGYDHISLYASASVLNRFASQLQLGFHAQPLLAAVESPTHTVVVLPAWANAATKFPSVLGSEELSANPLPQVNSSISSAIAFAFILFA
jgi:hypothetical protein